MWQFAFVLNACNQSFQGFVQCTATSLTLFSSIAYKISNTLKPCHLLCQNLGKAQSFTAAHQRHRRLSRLIHPFSPGRAQLTHRFMRRRVHTKEHWTQRTGFVWGIEPLIDSLRNGFRAVTAEQYRWELVHDAFINGLASAAVQQRLLERDDLSLEAAFELAYSLERAQQQSSSYSINVATSNVVLQRQRSADSLAGADVGSAYAPVSDPLPHGLAATVENKRCYFCGRPYHKRSRCPARYATCHTCKVIMQEFACLRINLYRPELLLSLKAFLPR